ncbi:phage tail protein [uncultured Roseibium sp.]|uniref:phage tail protein n=1 Tax=uncultured Roseibium sp. TaxID=1936171 RepID=UPI0026344B9D|nr:phage tail protein [uncultured Roseibium sp.]
MLYMIGAVQISTYPFSVDGVSRSHSADLAKKPVLNGLKPVEFMGEGDDRLHLRGQLLPHKLGGLRELEALREHMTKGASLPVMRGDGVRLGTFVIKRISDNHSELLGDGVGGIVKIRIALEKVPGNGNVSPQIIPSILRLFDFLG